MGRKWVGGWDNDEKQRMRGEGQKVPGERRSKGLGWRAVEKLHTSELRLGGCKSLGQDLYLGWRGKYWS